MSAVELGCFADTPWGQVPAERRADLVCVAQTPRGGLCGGSSGKSKLAALAKMRKEKAAAAAAGAAAGTDKEKTSVSLLARLSATKPAAAPVPASAPAPAPASASAPASAPAPALDTDTVRPRALHPVSKVENPASLPPVKLSGATEAPPELAPALDQVEDAPAKPMEQTEVPALAAEPSCFAKSIFGERISLQPKYGITDGVMFFVSGNNLTAKAAAAFSGPSPDDVVVKAQNSSKGLIITRFLVY